MKREYPVKWFLIVTQFALVAACSESTRLTPRAQREAAEQRTAQLRAEREHTELVARGKYLTTISGCNDCHSPKIMTQQGPEPDPERLLSGHPAAEAIPPIDSVDPRWVSFSMGLTSAVGPWGVSYAANLTPDATGIGNWTFQQFETALRKGKAKGLENGRDLLPPMPWQMIRNMSDADLLAVFTYLMSIKPVANRVPAPQPPDAARPATPPGLAVR